jgi:hypothetical protein
MNKKVELDCCPEGEGYVAYEIVIELKIMNTSMASEGEASK